MSVTAETLAALAALGIELPCRAIVDESAADSGGYRVTVDVLTTTGARTNQILRDVPLDRLWQGRAGAGVFAPPAIDQVVSIGWHSGAAGAPVLVASAPDAPAVPFRPVAVGEWALQDGQGAELRVTAAGLWRLASIAESLQPWLAELLATLRAAQTVHDTDTFRGSPGRELNFNGATIARLTVLAERLDNLLTP